MPTDGRIIQTVLSSWKLTNQRLSALISEMSDEDLQMEVAPGRNRVLYLVGHLAATNDRLFLLLGIGPRQYGGLDPVYIDKPDRALDDPLQPADLKKTSEDVASRLTAALERFSPEEWLEKHTAVSDEDFAKDPGRNRLAVVLSRTNHMSYHLGQIMLAYKRH